MMRVRPLGDFKMLGTRISVSKHKEYEGVHAVNQPDWERRGLIFITIEETAATEIGFLLPKEDYVIIT